MTIRDILVHVRLRGSLEPIEVAVRLAKAHGAYLTGLCCLRDVALLKVFAGDDDGAFIEKFSRERHALAASLEQRFNVAALQADVPHRWLIGEGEPADVLHVLGGLQDLVIVGQTPVEPSEPGWDLAEQTVFTPGQATLVVPHAGTFPVVGRRIVVAWNGSRQAAMALRAARPFLKAAENVTILMGKPRDPPPGVTLSPSIEVNDYIRRLNRNVDVRKFDAADSEAGEQIVIQAERVRADLVVMGAFGRSWLRERILGGATRHMLRNMPLPVLVAH